MARRLLRSVWVGLVFATVFATVFAGPVATPVLAQQDEAQALFTEANTHLARGLRLRGRRRTAELERALDGYLGVVQLGVRTRNVIFNLGLTHQELGRPTEAFNYYSEYLRDFDLGDEDRAEGERRRDSLRPEVAVVEITTVPEGADVRVDRRDLPVRGQTPLRLALPFGEHTVFVERAGYEPAEGAVTATRGESNRLTQPLTATPVSLQVLAPGNGTLTLDGAPLTSGQSTPVPPGDHVLVLSVPGAPPVERRFEVPVGGEPMVLEMNAEGPSGIPVRLTANTATSVFIDGAQVGMGEEVSLHIAPGEHRLRLDAAGYTPLVRSLTVPESPLGVRAVMGTRADNGTLGTLRIVFGVAALAGAAAWAVTGIGALVASAEWNDALDNQPRDGTSASGLHTLADRVVSWSNAADVSLGIGGALAAASLVVLLIPEADDTPSRLELIASGRPGGGVLTARWTFGGAL